VFVDPHATTSSRNLHILSNNVQPRLLAKRIVRGMLENTGRQAMENKVSVCRGLLHTFVEEEWPAGSLGESMYPILGEESASQISINLWVRAGAVVPIATVDSDIKTFDNSSAHLSRKRIGSSRVTQLFRNMGPGACIIYVYGGY
jgi:hypothetical protein